MKNELLEILYKNKQEYLDFTKEIESSDIIKKLDASKEEYDKTVSGKTNRGQDYSFGAIPYQEGIDLYSIVRKMKPEVLVETGVCNGVSTAFILLALQKNDSGLLYSIDYPEIESVDYTKDTFWEGKGGAAIPRDKMPGWIIPEFLKSRWELILGKSQEKLPPLLQKLKEIDFFMHDSEHSYECMTFEYNEAYKFLRKIGLLISDDITWNSAFTDFSNKYKLKLLEISDNIGLVIK